jgi:PAS domain S-box-containing protein
MNTEHQYRNRLNSLLEGIQIIDSNWRYVYLNDIMTSQSKTPKEELLGHTMMEKFPGIEDSEFFQVLQKTMQDRQTRRFENEFIFPDKSVRWFDLSIQPAEEGVCILSLDITEHKESEAKISKGKSLYSFLSHINQSIVHLTDDESLFKSACQAAIEFGKFKIAWIGVFSDNAKSINLIEQNGMPSEHIPYFTNATLSVNSPQQYVLEKGTFFSCDNIERDLDHAALKACATDLDICSFIVLPLRKSGKIIGTFNLYSDKPYFTGNDEILLLEEVTTDISFALNNFEKEKRHRETEQIVLENEKRFRALIEKSTDMKTLATAEGKLFYGSPSITKKLGYDIEKMMHTVIFDLIHPDDVGDFIKKRQELLQNPGSSFSFQSRMKHADGRWIWCEGVATNLLEESGVHAVVSNFRDISEKKRAEQQAEFDKNNTNALINNTNDLMWSIDKNLQLITSNRAFDKLSEQVYGIALKKGEQILRPEMSATNRKHYEKLYQKSLSGKAFSQTVRLSLPDGNWSEISFSPIYEKHQVIGVACHSRDITERMETELELERQNKELIKTNFELDRFVYSVSHDLRSPLTSIMGLVSFIEEETAEPETLEHVKMIKSGIDRLDGFIKNILSYSRTNRTKTEISKIELTEIAEEVVETLRHIRDAEGIDFEIAFEENQPFYSDKQSLFTLFENIVSNAIKFHKKENIGNYIKISGQTHKDFLDLTIEDNGIGIPSEHQDRIFEMFFRSSAKIAGSGIGLYIVKEIVAKLQGSIEVDSKLGRGTAFHIRLKNLSHE